MAYITNRPEEERQSVLGGGGGLAGGSGQGVGGAPTVQAGVSKGTGGSQPWVNIQNYLRANPKDVSASRALERDFSKPLEESTQAAQSELGRVKGELNAQKSGMEQALSDVDSNLHSARDAYRQSVFDFAPNPYGGAINRAVEASGKSFTAPQFDPKYLDAGLGAKAAQLEKDPYGYLSQRYSEQGLSSGQRALQDQLTRKSTNFPMISNELTNKYHQAQQAIEGENAAVARDLSDTDASYRAKMADANRRALNFRSNQKAIENLMPAGNEEAWKAIAGIPTFAGGNFQNAKSLPEIGKLISDALKNNPNSNMANTYQSWQQDYNRVRDALLNKYGFGG